MQTIKKDYLYVKLHVSPVQIFSIPTIEKLGALEQEGLLSYP
jgi:hypothetical protein